MHVHVTATGHAWLIDPCPEHGPTCWHSRWRPSPELLEQIREAST